MARHAIRPTKDKPAVKSRPRLELTGWLDVFILFFFLPSLLLFPFFPELTNHRAAASLAMSCHFRCGNCAAQNIGRLESPQDQVSNWQGMDSVLPKARRSFH